MAIVFPASPSVNDTFNEGSITYKWDGDKWIGLGVTPADKLVEGSNKLEIDGSNNLVWTGNNVGIGTDVLSASSKLTLFEESGNGQTLEIKAKNSGGVGSQPGIKFTANNGDNIGGVYGDVNSDTLKIQTGGTDRLTITSAGLSEFTASSTVATFTGNGIEVNNSLGSNVFIGTQSGSDGKLGTKNNSQMSLFTNSDFAKRASLGTNGDFTLNDGDFVVQSGHGINFSATSDGGGMTSELLDDYEEGTWTPVCTSSGYTLISASTKGFYTKIGNLVSIHFQVKFSSVGTNLASASFSGVPFASSSELHHAGVTRESTSYGDIFVAQVVAGNANVAINSMDGVVNGDNASFAINRNYNTQLTYFV